MRKTLFFQKKIRLLNAQFTANIVVTQMRDNLALESCLFALLTLKAMYTIVGTDNTRSVKTTKKQEEILFKRLSVLFSGDASF